MRHNAKIKVSYLCVFFKKLDVLLYTHASIWKRYLAFMMPRVMNFKHAVQGLHPLVSLW